jgi:hypothetical protein
MPSRGVSKVATQIQRLVRAGVLKTSHLKPRQVAMLERLSPAEVSALISMRRKFGGKVYQEGVVLGFGPL